MKPQLTPRERMLVAIRNQEPDVVPVAPDISNMVPCRLTGKPFWKIYLDEDPPVWRAYVDAVRYFGIDGWFIYGKLDWKYSQWQPDWVEQVTSREPETGWIRARKTLATPAGDLWTETTYYPDNSPTVTRKMIKNLEEDMPKLRWIYRPPTDYDASELEEQRRELGDLGVLGISIGLPGFQSLIGLFDGNMEAATYAYADHRDQVMEIVSLQAETLIRQAELAIDAKPDFILVGASGLGTLNNPRSLQEMAIPVAKKITRIAKEAGMPTMLHSCGKERQLVEIFAAETDLDCINPLVVPPQGDCDLAEVKAKFGHRLSLMGNLHTSEVMLRSKETVAEAARQAIDAAGRGGGFILSTGDQCGRDTPDENLFTLVRTAREYGRY